MEIKKVNPENFPNLLKEIPSPPKEIYIAGNYPNENAHFLAVVGTRKFSNYGKDVCEKLIAGLAGHNFVIVSGLALGIDAIAHSTALRAGIPTVAVPGSGLSDSVIHPHSHLKLSKQIVDAGGCLLSEFPPDYPASIHTFPRRNRSIAGLTTATLVIEAPNKSGALITSKFALDLNRDVMAVPGPIFNEHSKGTNGLIRRGAIPITCAEDILDAFGVVIALPGQNLKLDFSGQNLSPLEKEILEKLGEPISKDDLIRKIGKPTTLINPALTMMQINGLIKESGGEIFKNI
jgi:DNA processing protein